MSFAILIKLLQILPQYYITLPVEVATNSLKGIYLIYQLTLLLILPILHNMTNENSH